MKLGIISDLHADFWPSVQIIDFIESLKDYNFDVLIQAGDITHGHTTREYLLELHKKVAPNFIYCYGNHDYYKETLTNQIFTQTFDGIKFVSGTMWTDFRNGNPLIFEIVRRGLNDSRYIQGYGFAKLLDMHNKFLRTIQKESPDIIVSHHAPSFKSIAPKFYQEGELNYGFASHLDEFIMEQKPKLWIHGHVHYKSDYKIGTTRIVANPLGYPGELYKKISDYKPMEIEI